MLKNTHQSPNYHDTNNPLCLYSKCKNVALIPNIKFPLGKSSRMLDVKDTWTRMFYLGLILKPQRNWKPPFRLFSAADKWTNRCGPSTSSDVILPQGREGAHTGCTACGPGPWNTRPRAQAKGRVEAVRAGWGGRWPASEHMVQLLWGGEWRCLGPDDGGGGTSCQSRYCDSLWSGELCIFQT